MENRHDRHASLQAAHRRAHRMDPWKLLFQTSPDLLRSEIVPTQPVAAQDILICRKV